MYLAAASFDLIPWLALASSALTTRYAVAGSSFGGVKLCPFNSVIRALSFLDDAFATCSAVRTFLTRTFGLAFDFALVFGLALAVVLAFRRDFGLVFLDPGLGPGLALTVEDVLLEDVLLAAGLVVVVAFFRGLLVVLPVCAFGLDAGFVAKERRPMVTLLPLKLHVCPLGKVYPV